MIDDKTFIKDHTRDQAKIREAEDEHSTTKAG
jgi:hypothetical protein